MASKGDLMNLYVIPRLAPGRALRRKRDIRAAGKRPGVVRLPPVRHVAVVMAVVMVVSGAFNFVNSRPTMRHAPAGQRAM
jgi:hypothetical protein